MFTASKVGSSVTLAGDVLVQLERRRRFDGEQKDEQSRLPTNVTSLTRKRSRTTSTTTMSTDASYQDEETEDFARETTTLSSLLSGAVKLSDRVSLTDHLRRLLYLLSWSDRNGSRWMGIRRFIDCYFSLVVHPYFGSAFELNVLHVAKSQKICAVFNLANDRTYTVLVMLNYPLWDSILQVASSLPNRYFRRSVRSRLFRAYNDSSYVSRDKRVRLERREAVETDKPVDESNFTSLFNVSLAALCLIDRLEYSMAADFNSCGATHVVTLAKFFTMCDDAKNIFHTTTSVE